MCIYIVTLFLFLTDLFLCCWRKVFSVVLLIFLNFLQYFYLFMLLGRNSSKFERFVPKDIPHLIHLFSFFILVD